MSLLIIYVYICVDHALGFGFATIYHMQKLIYKILVNFSCVVVSQGFES